MMKIMMKMAVEFFQRTGCIIQVAEANDCLGRFD
jgi:hypothetical protein